MSSRNSGSVLHVRMRQKPYIMIDSSALHINISQRWGRQFPGCTRNVVAIKTFEVLLSKGFQTTLTGNEIGEETQLR
jgi:hypothetical protein